MSLMEKGAVVVPLFTSNIASELIGAPYKLSKLFGVSLIKKDPLGVIDNAEYCSTE